MHDPRPGRLMDELEELTQDRKALRGRARLSIDAPDLSFSRPQRMAAERPGRLRVEVLSLFDQVAALVVTRDSAYQFYDVRSDRLEEGRTDPEILWRVARIDLTPEEAVSLLLGVPLIQPGLVLAGSRGYEDGSVAVSRRDDQGVERERYLFDREGRLIEMRRLSKKGEVVFTARYSDYRPLPTGEGQDGSFPFDLEMEFPRVDATARLDFKQVELPASLPSSLFELSLPRSSFRTPGPASLISSGFRP